MLIAIRLSTGLTVGVWNLPCDDEPIDDAASFADQAADIGWHIALAISNGHVGCFFIEVGEDFKPDVDVQNYHEYLSGRLCRRVSIGGTDGDQ